MLTLRDAVRTSERSLEECTFTDLADARLKLGKGIRATTRPAMETDLLRDWKMEQVAP